MKNEKVAKGRIIGLVYIFLVFYFFVLPQSLSPSARQRRRKNLLTVEWETECRKKNNDLDNSSFPLTSIGLKNETLNSVERKKRG